MLFCNRETWKCCLPLNGRNSPYQCHVTSYSKQKLVRTHTTYSWNTKWQKSAGISGLWVVNEIIQKKNILKIWKKSWEPFGSYLLNSTAIPAHFHSHWAGLAVLFCWQLLNGSQDFFRCNTLIFIYFSKYKTIDTHARAFLPLDISAVGCGGHTAAREEKSSHWRCINKKLQLFWVQYW